MSPLGAPWMGAQIILLVFVGVAFFGACAAAVVSAMADGPRYRFVKIAAACLAFPIGTVFYGWAYFGSPWRFLMGPHDP